MANQRKNEDKQKYYIPYELKRGTVLTPEYENAPHHWSKIGNRMARTILIPSTKEVYTAYMRPEWREDKRRQRYEARELSGDEIRDVYELELKDEFNLEEEVIKKELVKALRQELATLKELDRTILQMAAEGFSEKVIGYKVGMSQKGVNKRKHRLLEQLYKRLKDYR